MAPLMREASRLAPAAGAEPLIRHDVMQSRAGQSRSLSPLIMRSRTLIAVLAAALLLACGGREAGTGGGDGATGGTLVIATSSEPEVLFPPLMISTSAKQVTDQVYDYLADIGDDMGAVDDHGFTPRLADRWEWSKDSLSIAFHIDPRAKWHDGRAVTANDVRFTHAVYSDPATGSWHSSSVAEVDSVTVRDSATAVFWFSKRFPEQFFQAAYQMAILPEHLFKDVKRSDLRTAANANVPIGTGRFRFVNWNRGQTLEIIADTTNFRGRPKLDRVIWSLATEYTAGLTKLLSGEADFFETLRAENLAQVTAVPTLRAMPYPSMQYAFMAFNLRDPKNLSRPHPVLADRAMRRALTMALDRPKMVQSVLGQLGIPSLGPFARVMRAGDTTFTQIPYDTVAAKQALDSLGWRDSNGDGVRDKGGRPLELTLITPGSSQNRTRMAGQIQEQLRLIGAKVTVQTLENNTQLERQAKRDFDAYMGIWATDPSPSTIRQTWGSEGGKLGESNYSHYVNPRFTALVDTAIAAAFDMEKAKDAWHKVFQQIIDDAPAVWLYEPNNQAGIHKRIQPAGVRVDAWWAKLPEWSVDANARIDRDKIGLRPTPPPTKQ